MTDSGSYNINLKKVEMEVKSLLMVMATLTIAGCSTE